jgi:predicted nucleic acid-binding Zn ribbon protein
MPTYAFKCPKCSSEIETIMKVSEYTEGMKPMCCADDCGGQQAMVSIPVVGGGFQLKGTGWTPKGEHSWGAPTDIVMPKKR